MEASYCRGVPLKKRGPFRDFATLLPGTPCSAGCPVRAGNYDNVAVRVSHPALPMIGTALTIRRVSMLGHDDLNAHFRSALDY